MFVRLHQPPHQPHISCSGRALCRLAPAFAPVRRDVRSCVRKQRTTEQHQTHISCSGRALCRPRTNLRTKPTSVVVAAPCAGLAPAFAPARRDVRSCVRKQPPNQAHISCSGRALCRLAPAFAPVRRDVRSCVRKQRTTEQHQTLISCSGRAPSRPRTNPTS